MYLYNWADYLGQDTPGKEIFNLSEVLSWLNKGKEEYGCSVYQQKKNSSNILFISTYVKSVVQWHYLCKILLMCFNQMVLLTINVSILVF